MKVLIISCNSLPASPAGPAYIAGAALKAGHIVEVFECLFAENVAAELQAHMARFNPDVIGVSIRLVHGYVIDETAPFKTRHLDLRIRVKEVVNSIRQVSQVPIVLGGPGFNYYARAWLDYLDVDYGIRGEADFSFPLYLERLEHGGDLTSVPGCVYRKEGQIFKTPREYVDHLDETALPAYELFDLEKYSRLGISPAILSKRGCAFRCMYCPYRSLEGARYRLKSPARVVDEMEYVLRVSHPKMILFCENNFNSPKRHAEAICREIIARKLKVCWGTGDLRPMGITEDFCHLLSEAGCNFVNLSVESGSAAMLKQMQRGYTPADIHQAFACLGQSGIPYSASLMIGAPGETPETIAESLALIERYPIPLGTWATIGICLWTPRQAVLAEAKRAGQYHDEPELFEGVNYLSPELPKAYMIDLIESLQRKAGITVQVNKPYAEYAQ